MKEDHDPLKQVHAAKEAVAVEYGYDIAAMLEAFRTRILPTPLGRS